MLETHVPDHDKEKSDRDADGPQIQPKVITKHARVRPSPRRGQLVPVSSSKSIPSNRISDLKPDPNEGKNEFLVLCVSRLHYTINIAYITMNNQSNRTSHLCSPHHQLKLFNS